MRRLSLAAGLVLIGAAAPSAAANTATIGSALSQPSKVNGISTGSITVQRSQVGGSSPHPLTSPANGVVTEWAVMSRDAGAVYSLRILRPTGPTTYLAAGTAVAPTADPGGSTTILRYPASLPIRQGDAIGLTPGGDSDAGIPQAETPGLTANLMAVSVGGAPDGGTASFTSMEGRELLLQATVKYCAVGKLKGKTLKAARKALAAADCAAKIVRKPARKKKQVGKVTKQKAAPGTTAPPGTQIKLIVGKKD